MFFLLPMHYHFFTTFFSFPSRFNVYVFVRNIDIHRLSIIICGNSLYSSSSFATYPHIIKWLLVCDPGKFGKMKH